MRDVPVIAIVDDDASFREALERFLGTFALRVRSFASGEEFLQSTELPFVSCLLLDLAMPGMNGLEVNPVTTWSNPSRRPMRSRFSQNRWTSRCSFAWCEVHWESADQLTPRDMRSSLSLRPAR